MARALIGIIKSYFERSDCPAAVEKMDIYALRRVVTNLLASNKGKDKKIESLEKQVRDLQKANNKSELDADQPRSSVLKNIPSHSEKEANVDPCAFDAILTKNVPHILEKIFLSLDYGSFKKCLDLNTTWKELLTTDSYKMKGKHVFWQKILLDGGNLWHYSMCGKTEEVRRLLCSGMVDVNLIKEGDKESTPLYEAVSRGHIEVVQLLLNAGADPNRWHPNNGAIFQQGPLLAASYFGHKDLVKMLLENGADPGKADSFDRTPLHAAAANNYTNVMELLLDCGLDPSLAGLNGWTPLHLAAIYGQLDAVKVLLDRGADCNLEDQNGETALSLAEEYDHPDIANELLNWNINMWSKFDCTLYTTDC